MSNKMFIAETKNYKIFPDRVYSIIHFKDVKIRTNPPHPNGYSHIVKGDLPNRNKQGRLFYPIDMDQIREFCETNSMEFTENPNICLGETRRYELYENHVYSKHTFQNITINYHHLHGAYSTLMKSDIPYGKGTLKMHYPITREKVKKYMEILKLSDEKNNLQENINECDKE
mgnify:CR=1 FL=1